jgi:pyruvate/2-oxoglutarate dehydrogenase complex dihydrolipoamide acyltransferase (E2) component
MAATSNLPQFLHDLLMAQAVHVAGTEAACFMIEPGQKEQEAILRLVDHIRPDNSPNDIKQQAIQAFQEIVKPCVIQGKDGAIEIGPAGVDAGGEMQFCLVTLLRSEGNTVAVSAVITRCLDGERAKQRLMSMQLVAGYFDLFMLKRASEQAKSVAESHQDVLQLATAAAGSDGFENAAKNLCNELATRTGAVRVALGWEKGTNIKVVAMSHTEKFDKKQELIIQLQQVMEECADQDSVIQYRPNGESSQNVTREAQMLSRAQGGNGVLALPLRRKDEVVGVIVLEFLPQQEMPEQAATGLAVAIDLVAPQLWDRHANDRWLITKAGLSLKFLAEETIGPRQMLAKGIVFLSIIAFLVLFVFSPMYHVKAAFNFIAPEKRVVSAPFEGYISKVYVLPGDTVKAGQPLLDLDTFELQLKKSEAMAETSRAYQTFIKARGEGKSDEMGIADAERRQHQADVDLLDHEIAKSHIVAPIDGKILSGDLKDKTGSAIKVGEQLFEVAQLDHLQAELSVEDRDMQDVMKVIQVGKGKLATTALPWDKHSFTIDHVVPQGEPKEGSNIFKVYCNMTDTNPTWLPGQTGEARIDIEKRPLIQHWTGRLIDFLRLKLWM